VLHGRPEGDSKNSPLGERDRAITSNYDVVDDANVHERQRGF
jgi:hypothetical protein